MKNVFGEALTLTLFGESHGPAVGATLDGVPPGLIFDEEDVRTALALRRPHGSISTARAEADEFSVLSGVFRGKTTGTPLTIVIPNADAHSGDYEYGRVRPERAFRAEARRGRENGRNRVWPYGYNETNN